MGLTAEKLRWYRNRLAAMSSEEIRHRVFEAAKRRIDRVQPPQAQAHDYGPLPEIPGLRAGLENWDVPRALLGEWREDAAAARAGKFDLLGQIWSACAPDRQWHFDPVSGTFWPHDRYCFAIDYRHASDKGDIKYVWELNRLQYLHPAAALAYKRRDRELARYCLDEITGWIAHNPPYSGVNWASGIELALRVVSILTVATLTGEYLDTRGRGQIWGTLAAHGAWLARYPSRFSSANNHLVAEGLGLFALGALCPQLPQAAAWRTQGWDILTEAAQQQILPDGVGAEQTITYTAVVLEMLLLGWRIASATGIPVPPEYLERITQGGIYLRWFMDGSGQHPFIGDNDNARVLGVYRRDETYVRSILGCIAAVSGRADLTPPNLQPHLRQALFGQPPTAEGEILGVKNFRHGGYTVGRHRTADHDMLLAFDHGHLGYLAIAAHGHADALAVWLHLDGQPVLTDAGTYLYHSGGTWRRYFRSTAAHNTLCLEDADSSIMAGNFNWSHKAGARLTAYEAGTDSWLAEAEHDGYLQRFGVLHRRRLRVTSAQGFNVEDRLTGDGAHQVSIAFLLHPSLRAAQESGIIAISRDGKPLLHVSHDGPLTASIGAADSPDGGWYSESFGIKTATSRLMFRGRMTAEQTSVVRFTFPRTT